MSTTIYVIRHAQSNANIRKRKPVPQKHLKFWGSRLSNDGKIQAYSIAQQLESVALHHVYSSALTRAKQTAQIIHNKQQCNATILENTHERFYGTDYFLLSKDQKKAARKAVKQLPNEESKMSHRFSFDGESAIESATRLKTAIEELARKHNGQTIALVSHGAVMRMFLVLIGWAQYNQLPSKTIENTGYFVLEVDGGTMRVKETVGISKKNIVS